MLAKRVLAALVFAPALAALVWWGGLPLKLTCLILAWLMLWETLSLTLGSGQRYYRGLAFALGTCLALGLLGLLPMLPAEIWLPGFVLTLLAASLVQPEPIPGAMQRVALVGLATVYAAGLIPFLAKLRELEQGLGFCLIAIFCTWAADTGAYFAGRFLGRHKLYPRISPGKTVEGGIGGLLAGVGTAFLARWVVAMDLSAWHTAFLGVIAAGVGLIGDLAESLLKRSVGAKDSGGLIPGHGGVLDRFDAVMFVAPTIYLYAMWLDV